MVVGPDVVDVEVRVVAPVEAVPVRRDALVDPQAGRLPCPAREADKVGNSRIGCTRRVSGAIVPTVDLSKKVYASSTGQMKPASFSTLPISIGTLAKSPALRRSTTAEGAVLSSATGEKPV